MVVDVGEPGAPSVRRYGSRLERRLRWRDGAASLCINIHKQDRGVPAASIMHRNVDEEA